MATGDFYKPYPQKDTESQTAVVDKFRSESGLKRHKSKMRACLNCDRMFKSFSVASRLCEPCRKRD